MKMRNHLLEYVLLATAGVFFLFLFSLFKGDRTGQFTVMVFFTAFYVGWGIIHHLAKKTLRLKVMVEYILIGALCVLLLEIFLLF